MLGMIPISIWFCRALPTLGSCGMVDASVVFRKTSFAAHDACHCWCGLQRMLVLLAAADSKHADQNHLDLKPESPPFNQLLYL